MHFVSSWPLHLPLHLQPSGSCYATPSAPRNRSTKTHGFTRITITITIIQEQIHKSYINSTAARRSPHRFHRTCCPLPQHLQGSLACLSSGRRPAPGSHCLGRSTAAGREPHRFLGICCPLPWGAVQPPVGARTDSVVFSPLLPSLTASSS